MFSPLTCGKNQPVPAFYETGVSLFSGILHAPSGEHPSYIIGHLVSGDVLQYTIRDAGYIIQYLYNHPFSLWANNPLFYDVVFLAQATRIQYGTGQGS